MQPATPDQKCEPWAHGFQRSIAGAELRVYPGAGHVPMEEFPETTARDADAFLGPAGD